MSRLIVVSNRVSAPTDPAAGSAGGLAMALSAALRKYDGLWFGWSGERVDHYTGEVKIEDRAGVTVRPSELPVPPSGARRPVSSSYGCTVRLGLRR